MTNERLRALLADGFQQLAGEASEPAGLANRALGRAKMRRWSVAVGGGLTAVAIIGGALALTSTGIMTEETTEQPRVVASGSRPPGYTFKDLPVLVATSDVVVMGTVTSAAIGPPTSSDPTDPLRWRDVVVDVDEQFYGLAAGSTIVAEQLGYDGDVPIETSEQPWLYPGDRAILFLTAYPGAEEGTYEIMLPGEWKIRADNTVSTFAHDPAARALDGQDLDTVTKKIKNAVETVREKDIKPLRTMGTR